MLIKIVQGVVIEVELADLHDKGLEVVEEKVGNSQYEKNQLNNRPIIGVLSQEMDPTLDTLLPAGHNYTSYIAGSYVQWVESGGARVVPVIIGKEKAYYEQLFKYLNGLLFPGGDAPLTGPGGYAEVGEIFFNLAMNSSQEGDPFPIWGTCNGFELLTVLSSKDKSRLIRCNSENVANPLHLLPTWRLSKIYGKAPHEILQKLTKERVTINFHENCLTPANFTKYKMDTFWSPLSYNFDSNKLEYLSTIEAKNYPFIGTQFHPEKNIFEWAEESVDNIPHSKDAVAVSLYYSTYFVNLARQSHHSFPDRATEESHLVYNYHPMYTGRMQLDWTFQLAYLF